MRVVKVIIGLGLGLVIAGGLGYTLWLKPQLEFASVATAYGAKKMCSCLFVSDLSLDSCKADFTEDISMVDFTPDETGVTVEVLGGRISARADYQSGLGCALVPED